jgi:PAS domain-containing protein
MKRDMIIPEEYFEPRRQPTQALRSGLPDLDGLSLEDMRTLVQELQVRQAELDADNEVLRRSQYRFERSQSEYSEFYDSAPVGYFTISGEGLILEVNPTGAGLLGFDKHSLIGKPLEASWTKSVNFRLPGG